MQNQEQMIEIFHQGFLLCMVLAGSSGVVTMVFFRKFQIRRWIAFCTGREAKKEIQKIKETNEKKEIKDSPFEIKGGQFMLKKNVMLIHTEEVIEKGGEDFWADI